MRQQTLNGLYVYCRDLHHFNILAQFWTIHARLHRPSIHVAGKASMLTLLRDINV